MPDDRSRSCLSSIENDSQPRDTFLFVCTLLAPIWSRRATGRGGRARRSSSPRWRCHLLNATGLYSGEFLSVKLRGGIGALGRSCYHSNHNCDQKYVLHC